MPHSLLEESSCIDGQHATEVNAHQQNQPEQHPGCLIAKGCVIARYHDLNMLMID